MEQQQNTQEANKVENILDDKPLFANQKNKSTARGWACLLAQREKCILVAFQGWYLRQHPPTTRQLTRAVTRTLLRRTESDSVDVGGSHTSRATASTKIFFFRNLKPWLFCVSTARTLHYPFFSPAPSYLDLDLVAAEKSYEKYVKIRAYAWQSEYYSRALSSLHDVIYIW